MLMDRSAIDAGCVRADIRSSATARFRRLLKEDVVPDPWRQNLRCACPRSVMKPDCTVLRRGRQVGDGDPHRCLDQRQTCLAEPQGGPSGSADKGRFESRVSIGVRHPRPGVTKDGASLKQSRELVGEVGELPWSRNETSVCAGSLEARERRDGAQKRNGSVGAGGETGDKDPVHVEATGEVPAATPARRALRSGRAPAPTSTRTRRRDRARCSYRHDDLPRWQ
jgi:hypothetical protein